MTMPFITVLEALKAELVDALDGRTVGGKPITVRHHRHRETREDEWPCVSIRYISNDPSAFGRQENDANLPEEVMELAVNLVIDMALPPEATDESDADLDPTGFGCHAQVLAIILDRLLPGDEADTLGGTTWNIRYDGSANDEADASPDEARLEERLSLFYRVRADQPTVLLMGN